MKKYKIIYADLAWKYGSSELYIGENGKRFNSLNRIYSTMTDCQLKQLPISKIADEDCVLFMWATDSHLKEALEVIKAWGFDYKTIAFNWIKKTKNNKICCNLGAWTMKSWELCLIATKGQMLKYKQCNNVRGLIEAERTQHSKKPDVIREKIVELFGDLPRIELFARQKIDGWDCWGNEVESDIDFSEV